MTPSDAPPAAPFHVDEELQQLRDSVRRFLGAHSDEAKVRADMDSADAYDTGIWRMLAGQLDVVGLTVPTTYGGAGYSLVQQAVVLEEIGRRLTCVPYLSTAVLGVQALLAADDEEARRRLLPSVVSGKLCMTVALSESDVPVATAAASLTATEHADGLRLNGVREFVLDADAADVILTPAMTRDGIAWFQVDSTSGGVERTPMRSLDPTRRLSRVRFDNAGANVIATGAPQDMLRRLLDVAAVGLAAEQLGGAEEALASAVAYAKTRQQFGAPIGSFQAIKHKCAEALVAVESARTLVTYGAWAHTGAPGEFPVVAAMAKSFCSEMFVTVAAMNIQIHGALGFTWEHSAHLYLKRAKTSEQLWGSPRHHRRLIAERLAL